MDEAIISRNPRTGEVVGSVVPASPDEVTAAVTLARKAFADWSGLGVEGRLPFLRDLKAAVLDATDEIAALVVAETGKATTDAILTEVTLAAATADYVIRRSGRLLRPERRSAWPFAGARAWVEYHPLGVAGIISPWNYPFSLPFNPMVMALAAGCTAVVKPSPVAPLSGELVVELARRAGLPTGVVQVVHGGAEIGRAVVEQADVVSFTGSPKNARTVAAVAAKTLTPVIFELGGKDAMIVLEDADLRRAARAAVWGGLVNAGQTCISVERIYVVDAVYEPFLAELRRALEPMHAGGDDAGDIGPLSHPPQMDIVQAHVADAVDKGATVLSGGERPDPEGWYYPPTLIVDVDHTMDLMREETFGPVLPVMRVPNAEAALELANDSAFGLHGSVWTKDAGRGRDLASRMRTGTVAINDALVNYGVIDLPFGGVGDSGYGSHQGREGLRSFCYVKSVTEARIRLKWAPWWFPRRGGPRFWKSFARIAARGRR